MTIYGKIERLLEKKTGVSERTGNAWARQQAVIRVYKLMAEGAYQQTNESLVVDTMDADILSSPNFKEGTFCRASIFCDTREYNGRVYQQNLLNGFMPVQENAPQPQVQHATAPQPATNCATVVPHVQPNGGANASPFQGIQNNGGLPF